MCISPDEMTTAELEAEIVGLERIVATSTRVQQQAWLKGYYQERIKYLEEYLKERAEAGTY